MTRCSREEIVEILNLVEHGDPSLVLPENASQLRIDVGRNRSG